MRQLLFDGGNLKSLPAWDVDSDRGWNVYGGAELTGERLLFARVPWLYRGVHDRANNVAAMPYSIKFNGEEVVTSSDASTMPLELAFLASLQGHLDRGEQSLAMTARAYWVKETNKAGYIKNMVYCAPETMEPVYSADGVITSYWRTVSVPNHGGTRNEIPAANVVAVFAPDYMTETGPTVTSPAMAAINAAGVLYNTDQFVANYFRRGAIKATILTAENSSESEATRLKNWWSDVVTGVKNAWTAIVLRSKAVTATVIGEGMESLQNTDLTKEQRQDIATALGIPESRLWSAAANYATRNEDERAYYRGTIIPECNLIADAINTQIFTAAHKLQGYTLEFQPESLDVFQEDEAARAGALSQLANIPGMPLKLAMEILGYDLTEEQWEELDEESEPEQAEAEQMPAIDEQQEPMPEMQPIGEPTAEDTANALATWKRKAIASVKRGGPADVEFLTRAVSDRVQTALHYELQVCETADQVKAAFEALKPTIETVDKLTPLMARALAILEDAHAA